VYGISAIKHSNIPPRSGIDKDARWGYSANKGWLFGYKLHLAASTGSLIVPLAADYTQANVYDNQRYRDLVGVCNIREGKICGS
jgi:hypothetical protein